MAVFHYSRANVDLVHYLTDDWDFWHRQRTSGCRIRPKVVLMNVQFEQGKKSYLHMRILDMDGY